MQVNARPHGAALVRPLAKAALGALVGTACIVLGGDVHWVFDAVGATALGLSALLAATTVLEWDRTDVLLTGDLLRVRWGVLRRRTAEVRLERDELIEIEQGLAGRLLGYGTVVAGGIEVPYVPVRGASVRGDDASAARPA
jgi:uncharacterized membrane protein YdbT with pleckstrin-like domain